MNRFSNKRFALGSLLIVLFAAGWLLGWNRATARDRYEGVDIFVDVLAKINQFYVDPIDAGELVEGAVAGMLRRLDPFSVYLDEDSFSDLQITTQGEYGGVGMVVSIRDEYPTVISPLEGTPAYRLGIRTGDVIVEIEGEPTRGLTINEVVKRLRGPRGTGVTIAIRREGESSDRDYTIIREIIRVKSVPYAMMYAGDIGYIRISSFSASTGDEVKRQLDKLEQQGARALILDLRENPGGLLSEAVDVSELFIAKGAVVVETRGRARNTDRTYTSSYPRPHLSQPLVVLVSAGSASASEIVAGAIQDHDRGLIVGQATFGKGSVQSVIILQGSRAALKLTTAKYYTPAGRSIHRDRFEAGRDTDIAAGFPAPNSNTNRDSVVAAPADTNRRPLFHTDSGRVVFGGGGILPDVVVELDSVQTLSIEIRRRSLDFKFANRYVASHDGLGEDVEITPEMWLSFTDLLRQEEVEFEQHELESQRQFLELRIKSEIVRRVAGDAAAFRAVSDGDKSLQKALELLRKARGPRDLIQLSSIR